MKASRLLLAALVAAIPSYLLASEIKGLNVLMTSADAQTQMMGMVLSASVLNDQKKRLRSRFADLPPTWLLKSLPRRMLKNPTEAKPIRKLRFKA